VTVSPWPFAGETLDAAIDGRLLRGPVGTQDELDRTLAVAPVERLRVTLRPG
jgi:hypothetical protein